MSLSVGFFLTNGVLSWRDAGRFIGHNVTKAIHLTFNLLALGSIAVGLFVTFWYNRAPHVVTLHSWVALSAALLLSLQAVGGLLYFLFPMFTFEARARVLPSHAWLGAVSYTMLVMTLILGIVEWQAYKATDRDYYKSTGPLILKVLGLVLFATALTTLWAILPRRNINVDLEERDGVSIDDPSRRRLKETGGAYVPSTNPFISEPPVPQRRAMATERF